VKGVSFSSPVKIKAEDGAQEFYPRFEKEKGSHLAPLLCNTWSHFNFIYYDLRKAESIFSKIKTLLENSPEKWITKIN